MFSRFYKFIIRYLLPYFYFIFFFQVSNTEVEVREEVGVIILHRISPLDHRSTHLRIFYLIFILTDCILALPEAATLCCLGRLCRLCSQEPRQRRQLTKEELHRAYCSMPNWPSQLNTLRLSSAMQQRTVLQPAWVLILTRHIN